MVEEKQEGAYFAPLPPGKIGLKTLANRDLEPMFFKVMHDCSVNLVVDRQLRKTWKPKALWLSCSFYNDPLRPPFFLCKVSYECSTYK